MVNKDLPKLIFFSIEPWKKIYDDRFLLKQLQERGFLIEYIWLGPLVGLLTNIPPKGCENVPKSWKEVQRIVNLEQNKDAILISLMNVFAPCLKLFRILSKAKQKTIGYFKIGSMHLPLKGRTITKNRIKLIFNITRLKYFLIHKQIPLLRNLGYLKDFDYAIHQGTQDINSVSQLISSKTFKISIIDYDIEHYNQVAKISDYAEGKYIVFIDAYMPFHPDWSIFATGFIDDKAYYKSVNTYLKRVEDKYGIPVIVAAHPSASKYHDNNYFDGRTVIFGKTAELCKGCAWSINHASTAITFMIVQYKPIRFITTNEIIAKYGISYELTYTEYFHSPLINIDNVNADISIPIVNRDIYDEFIDKCLYSNDTIGKMNVDILYDAFFKMHK